MAVSSSFSLPARRQLPAGRQRGQLTAHRLPGGIQTAQGVVEHFAPLSLHTGVGAAQVRVVLHTVKIQKRRAAARKFQRVLLQGLFHQCAVMHRTPAGIRFDDLFRPAASGHPHRLLPGVRNCRAKLTAW